MSERIRRWRLVLGANSQIEQPLEGLDVSVDGCLNALYGGSGGGDGKIAGGLGGSSPNVNRWLGDIRTYFPASTVQVMQKDAIERLGLERLLLEKETLAQVVPDVNLVATLLSLKHMIPAKTKETARDVVRTVVKDLEKRLDGPMREAITGALNRATRNRRPKLREIDWNRTIRKNLKHYQPEYKSIIPEVRIGYGRKGQALKRVILALDQSGSMASSVVYSSVFAASLASVRALETHVVAFDTSVVDLTNQVSDPVDLLFGVQLGGGTDIEQALSYCQSLVRVPSDTILVLISDLIEGGNEAKLIERAGRIKGMGVTFIALLALSDEGKPIFDEKMSVEFAKLGISSFACTPDRFPELMAAAIKGADIAAWEARTRPTK